MMLMHVLLMSVELDLPIHELVVGAHHDICLLLKRLALALIVLTICQLAIVQDLDGLHRWKVLSLLLLR